jgi:hypothetical protein
MTPKEKAKALVAKFENESWHDATGFKGGSNIRCALIAVDEILNNDGFTKFDYYLTKYWIEVKKEINLL